MQGPAREMIPNVFYNTLHTKNARDSQRNDTKCILKNTTYKKMQGPAREMIPNVFYNILYIHVHTKNARDRQRNGISAIIFLSTKNSARFHFMKTFLHLFKDDEASSSDCCSSKKFSQKNLLENLRQFFDE
jgi:hypothetical protein